MTISTPWAGYVLCRQRRNSLVFRSLVYYCYKLLGADKLIKIVRYSWRSTPSLSPLLLCMDSEDICRNWTLTIGWRQFTMRWSDRRSPSSEWLRPRSHLSSSAHCRFCLAQGCSVDRDRFHRYHIRLDGHQFSGFSAFQVVQSMTRGSKAHAMWRLRDSRSLWEVRNIFFWELPSYPFFYFSNFSKPGVWWRTSFSLYFHGSLSGAYRWSAKKRWPLLAA